MKEPIHDTGTWRGKDARELTLEEACQGMSRLIANLKIGHRVSCEEFLDVAEKALEQLERLQDLDRQ